MVEGAHRAGPSSVNPATGKPYGPDFPDIILGDIVRAQRIMLESLGVQHLIAVAGQSFGGFQAFQWAISYPDLMDGIVASVTAPKGSGGEASVKALLAQLAADPAWNGGWHYERGGIPTTMTALRTATLRRYGTDEILAATVPDPAARQARMREMAERWAREMGPRPEGVSRSPRPLSIVDAFVALPSRPAMTSVYFKVDTSPARRTCAPLPRRISGRGHRRYSTLSAEARRLSSHTVGSG